MLYRRLHINSTQILLLCNHIAIEGSDNEKEYFYLDEQSNEAEL